MRNYAHFELFWHSWTVYLAFFVEIWRFLLKIVSKRWRALIWQKISWNNNIQTRKHLHRCLKCLLNSWNLSNTINLLQLSEALKGYAKTLEMFDSAYFFMYRSLIFHFTNAKIKSCKKYHDLDLKLINNLPKVDPNWWLIHKKCQIRMTPLKDYQI